MNDTDYIFKEEKKRLLNITCVGHKTYSTLIHLLQKQMSTIK